jgi:hypothetical protein
MPFAYYARLSAARQRIYRKSDAIERSSSPRVSRRRTRRADPVRLRADDRRGVQTAMPGVDRYADAAYRVPGIRVRVLAQRPADEKRELHGLYEPEEEGERPRITVWMRTAARKDVWRSRRSCAHSIHELCHHLDYELYKVPRPSTPKASTSASRHLHTRCSHKRHAVAADARRSAAWRFIDAPIARRIRPTRGALQQGARHPARLGDITLATALVEPCPRTG